MNAGRHIPGCTVLPLEISQAHQHQRARHEAVCSTTLLDHDAVRGTLMDDGNGGHCLNAGTSQHLSFLGISSWATNIHTSACTSVPASIALDALGAQSDASGTELPTRDRRPRGVLPTPRSSAPKRQRCACAGTAFAVESRLCSFSSPAARCGTHVSGRPNPTQHEHEPQRPTPNTHHASTVHRYYRNRA